jgi:SAM-dependent methyltransferase
MTRQTSAAVAPSTTEHSRRLNLGCGPRAAPGWINCDLRPHSGIDICSDLRRGLAIASDTIDCIAAIHVLQDLGWNDIPPALHELRRVLKPGGVLRLAVPDLDKAIRAYLRGDSAYFYVPDRDAQSIGAKLITQIIWYGSVRTPCTFDSVEEWLRRAGFNSIVRRDFGASGIDELAALDNRQHESLFVEAVKPVQAGPAMLHANVVEHT